MGDGYWYLVNCMHENDSFESYEAFKDKLSLVTENFLIEYSTKSSKYINTDQKVQKRNVFFNKDLIYSEVHLKCKGKDEDSCDCPSEIKLSAAKGQYQKLILYEYKMEHNHSYQKIGATVVDAERQDAIVRTLVLVSKHLHASTLSEIKRVESIILNNSTTTDYYDDVAYLAEAHMDNLPDKNIENSEDITDLHNSVNAMKRMSLEEHPDKKMVDSTCKKVEPVELEPCASSISAKKRDISDTKLELEENKKQGSSVVKSRLQDEPYKQLSFMLRRLGVNKSLRKLMAVEKFECFIEQEDLKKIPIEMISFAELEGGYNLLQARCSQTAKKWLEAETKKLIDEWICTLCDEQSPEKECVLCERCVLWFHKECVGSTVDNNSEWFCSTCQGNN